VQRDNVVLHDMIKASVSNCCKNRSRNSSS